MTGTTPADPTKMKPRAPTCWCWCCVVGVARMESRLCRQLQNLDHLANFNRIAVMKTRFQHKQCALSFSPKDDNLVVLKLTV